MLEQKQETAHTIIIEQLTPSPEIRVGEQCPKCHKGILDYDGMLNLVCPQCAYISGGCFT
ncbi:MAG: hypothetical protein CVU39_25055 [Chloroflexi bacterium HGW-Chloroflexi-10]|nr:MAG: hypothetical protein CVU39_25055 [Chloroflexi bacterium HGW-Chloroflexi-10]